MRSKITRLRILAEAFLALLLLVSLVGISQSVNSPEAAAATQADQIVSFAASQAGVPYCDGGGGINGPTNGGVVEQGCGVGAKGFDCMTLVQYAVYQATGIVLPVDGTQPNGVGTFIPPRATIAKDEADLLPGDAVFWGGSGIDDFGHSGIYAGNGEVWDALNLNIPVQKHTMADLKTLYTYDGAMRFWTSSMSVTTTSLPAGVINDTYSAPLEATGGNPPYRWSVSSGSLPNGLKLKKSTGVISGKPKAAGTSSFTVQVEDAKTKTKPHTRNVATATLSITIT